MIRYDAHSDRYAFTDPATTRKSGFGGIELSDERGSFLRPRLLWKPKDLLTVHIQIAKSQSPRNATVARLQELDTFIARDKLHLSVLEKGKVTWLDSIDIGLNEIDAPRTVRRPAWNAWQFKQRSMLSHFVDLMHERRGDGHRALPNGFEMRIECKYDFDEQSWTLYRLREGRAKPNTAQEAADIIQQIERCPEMSDIIAVFADDAEK